MKKKRDLGKIQIDWNCRPRFGLRHWNDWKQWSQTRYRSWLKRVVWKRTTVDSGPLGSYSEQMRDSGRHPRDF